MKIVAQAVPPEFAAQMASYMQMADADSGTTGVAKKNPGLAASTVSSRVKRIPTDFEKAADYIATDQRARGSSTTHADLYAGILAAIKISDFSQPYWFEIYPELVHILQSTPTSVPRLITKPYAYRDPSNLPTMPTYPAGTTANFPLRADGATVSGYFEDTFIRYALYSANVANGTPIPVATPCFWRIDAVINAYASVRGTRPLLSAITKVQRCMAGEAPATDNMPPVIKPRYLNIRHQLPIATAPFYSRVGTIQAVITAAEPSSYTTAPTFELATLRIAPTPMMGQWYNNNVFTRNQFEPEVTSFVYRPGGFHEFSSNLGLQFYDPYYDCGATGNPCSGFFWDGSQTSVTIPAKYFQLATAIRSMTTGHIETGHAVFVPATLPEQPPYRPPPDPPYENDPFAGFNKLIFVGSAGTSFVMVLGAPEVAYDPDAHYSLMIRATNAAAPGWYPAFGGLDIYLADGL